MLTLASLTAHDIGYYGRRGILQSQGSKLHASAGGLERAHGRFH